MSDIDWKGIRSKLPYKRTDEDKAKRKKLFAGFDPNGNGYVSLAEVDRGVRDVLGCEELFDAKPAIMRAYQFAKNASKSKDKHSQDYLEFPEFRLFLQTLSQDFEYYMAFERIDTGDDHRINREEFTSPAMRKTIEKWVGPVEDFDAEFDKIDANGGGQILFSEFVEWAHAKNLDLEDDDD